MAKFAYPGNISEKHPVQTRISILKRFSLVSEFADQGINPDTQLSLKQFSSAAVSDVTSRTLTKQSVEKPEHQIYLYAPASIQFADGLTYDNQDLGLFAGALFAATETAMEEGTDGGGAMETAKNVATGAGKIVGGIGVAAAGEMAKATGIGQQIRLRTGVARNPRTEMLFKSPTLRQLSLTWKFMPTNQQESNHIAEMIKTVRAHSYPDTAGSEAVFSFPDIFQVDFVTNTGGEAQMIKFAKAYCTSVNTVYGASGPAFFKGGKPVEIDFTMSLQETEIQTRESILEGF
tara:strand:+ start:200 stop:1069 length:870 start_codon:yes stop_codon:yes gene_type:complete